MILKLFSLALIVATMKSSQHSLSDWIEKDISRYTGEYTYFEFDKSEIKQMYKITLSYQEGQLIATKNDKETETLSGACKLEGNKFRIKENKWEVNGKFVLKSPPPNAKGPIYTGLLINNRFYQGKQR